MRAIMEPIFECIGGLTYRCGPVSRLGLAELQQRWIPRGVEALAQPAPARVVAVKQPDRFAQRAREVSDCSVDTDHEIQIGDEGSGICKIAPFGTEIDTAGMHDI